MATERWEIWNFDDGTGVTRKYVPLDEARSETESLRAELAEVKRERDESQEGHVAQMQKVFAALRRYGADSVTDLGDRAEAAESYAASLEEAGDVLEMEATEAWAYTATSHQPPLSRAISSWQTARKGSGDG